MKRSALGALTQWLIRRAARSAPPSLADRLEEEWLADLAERCGSMARLRLALGCCWAMKVIAHEHAAENVLTAGSAAGHKIVAASTQHDPSDFSRRTTAFLLIVCLHALLICGLAVALRRTLIDMVPPTPLIVLPGSTTPIEPPPPLKPRVGFRQFEDPVPTPPVDGPSDPNVMEEVTPQPPQPMAPPSPRPVNRVLGGPGNGFPNTNEHYPPAAIRLREMGVVAVRVCIDAAGRLTADPVIAESSGSARLDEGAVRLARAGSGHYRATTEDGRLVSSCFPFRIRFELKD